MKPCMKIQFTSRLPRWTVQLVQLCATNVQLLIFLTLRTERNSANHVCGIHHSHFINKILESTFMAPSNQKPLYYSHKHVSPQLDANHHGNTIAKIALRVIEELTRITHIPPHPTPLPYNTTKLIWCDLPQKMNRGMDMSQLHAYIEHWVNQFIGIHYLWCLNHNNNCVLTPSLILHFFKAALLL